VANGVELSQSFAIPERCAIVAIHLSVIPLATTTPEDLTIQKIGTFDPWFTHPCILFAVDPADSAGLTFNNTDRHELRPGDEVEVHYTNTDSGVVNVELHLELI
jgi:hypothetical protein